MGTSRSWGWVAVAVTLAVLAFGCAGTGAPTGRRLGYQGFQTPTLADLERGERFAGISLETHMFGPDQKQLDAEWSRRRIGPAISSLDSISIKDIPRGDFEAFQIDYVGYGEPAVHVVLVPRWKEGSSFEERCRQFEFEPRELVALSTFFGTVVRTTRERWLAVLERDVDGKRQLAAVIYLVRPELFPPPKRWLAFDQAEEFVRELAARGATDDAQFWKRQLAAASELGLTEATEVLARIDAPAREWLEPRLARLLEQFEGATTTRQLELLGEIAAASRKVVQETGSLAPAELATLVEHTRGVLARVRADEKTARDAGRLVEAGALATILATFERHVPLERLTAENWFSIHRITRCASLGGWLLGQLELVEDGSPDRMVAQCRTSASIASSYTHPDDLSKEVLDELIRGFREAVAAAHVALADAAEARELHATAAGHYLIAHALRNEVAHRFPASFDGVRRDATLAGLERIPVELARARQAGTRLAAVLVPFVDARSDTRDDLAPAFDGNGLLAGLPFGDMRRLGLETGNRESQQAFARALGLPLCRLEPGPVRVTSAEVATSETLYAKTIEHRKVTSNDAAVLAWRTAVDGVLQRLDQLQDQADEFFVRSRIVRETRPWDRIGAFHGDSGVSEWRLETLESALDRLADAESCKRTAAEMEKVRADYEELWAQRPPEAYESVEREVATYPVGVQTWSIGIERDVALVWPGERHVHSGAATLSIEGLRAEARPDLDVPACDNWISEGEARERAADPQRHAREFLQFGLRSELEQRLRSYALSLEQRNLTELERWDERVWLGYFFHTDWSDELASGIPQVEALGHAYARP